MIINIIHTDSPAQNVIDRTQEPKEFFVVFLCVHLMICTVMDTVLFIAKLILSLFMLQAAVSS